MNLRLSIARQTRSALTVLALAAVLLAGCDSVEEKARKYVARAELSLAAGDLDKAALDFRNAIRLKPEDTEALMGLAAVDEKRHAFDEAVTIYASVAARDPKNLDSRLSLARILLASRQVERASDYAEQGFRLSPADPRVLAVKAGVALSLGNPSEARHLAEQALGADPANMAALMVLASATSSAGDHAGALAVLQRAPAAAQSNLALQLMKVATLRDMGDERGIEDIFRQLPAAFPRSAELRDTMVAWYLAKNRPQDAEAASRRFAEANPADAAAQVSLAKLIARTRGQDAAAAELRGIVAHFSADDPSARATLLIALAERDEAAGRPDASLAGLRDAVSSASDETIRGRLRLRLAQTLAAMQQWPEAAGIASIVLATDAGNAEALKVRARARAATGHDALAVEDLFAALGVSPNEPGLYLQMAQAYERMGSPTLADEQYAKSLAFSGYAAANGVAYARFLLRYGRGEPALRVLQDLRLRGTADRSALTLLAQMKLDAKDWLGAGDIATALKALHTPAGDAAAAHVEAMSLIGQGQAAEAVSRLEGRLAQAPAQQDAALDLATAHLAAGNRAQAEAAFTAAARADSSGTAGTEALAAFYLGSGDADHAERLARAGLSRAAGSTGLRLILARTLERRGAIDAAIAEYETLVAADPAAAVAVNNLASLLLTRNRGPEDVERAYALAGRFRFAEIPQFLDTLGWNLHLRGDQQEALAVLQRAAEKMPANGVIQYHLGMALKAAGQDTRSAAALAQASQLKVNGTGEVTVKEQ